MVFLLQNTQTRDTAAIQLKLDELIRANEKARNTMLCLEDLSEEQLNRLKSAFRRLEEIPATTCGSGENLEEAGAKSEDAEPKQTARNSASVTDP